MNPLGVMRRSRFAFRAGSLALASLIAQALSALNLIIMARIFAQADIGIYTVFISYSSIIVTFNLLSYEFAIPNLSQKETTAVIYGLLLLLLLIFVCVFLGFKLAGYGYPSALAIHTTSMGLIRLSEMLNIRDSRFRPISIARIAPHSFFLLVLIMFWLTGYYRFDMVLWGYVTAFSAVALGYFSISGFRYMKNSWSMAGITDVLKENKRNPLLVMPSVLFNNAAFNLPVILIERFFSAALAAQYGIVLRFCFAPVTMFGTTVGNVYHSELAHAARNQDKTLVFRFAKVKKYLFSVGVVIGLVIFLLFPPLIHFLLGPGWQDAGRFARILAPLFSIMVLVGPLSVSFFVFEKQAYLFVNQLSYFLITLVSFGAAILMAKIYLGIILFSCLSFVRYFFVFLQVNKLSREILRN